MDRALLRQSILIWKQVYQSARSEIIARSSAPQLTDRKFATAYIGVRRSGKTWQAIEQSVGLDAEEVFYFNFEDPIFAAHGEVADMETLLSVACEFSKKPLQMLILDELQNVEGWERWVRRMIDQRIYQVIVTGSSAKLLSRELATALSGRALTSTVWPLSLSEYLEFRQLSPRTPGEYLAAVRDIMKWGAFPEVVLEREERTKWRILEQYFDDIVFKDVIRRHDIRSKRALDQLVLYYMTHISSLHSYSSVERAFGIDADTVREYAAALAEAFLVFELNRYHPNLKVQARDPRKVYVVDLGLRTVRARSTQDDTGKLLENLVFLELKRRGKQLSYYKGKQGIDFVTSENYKPLDAIQVTASDLEDQRTYDREVNALLECLKTLDLRHGTIIAMEREENIKIEDRLVSIVPAYPWLLEG